MDFPNAGLGEAPSHKNFLIQNLSAGHRLAGYVGAPSGPFSITTGGGAFNLPRLGMLKVKMNFAPGEPGLEKGSLIILSGDPLHPSIVVNLRGTGEPGRLTTNIPVTLDNKLAFGPVALNGSPKLLSFRIKNIGEGDLQGNVPSLSLPFTVIRGGGPFDLAPGHGELVTVLFTPTAMGHVSQSLTIAVTPPSRPSAGITVTVAGRGT